MKRVLAPAAIFALAALPAASMLLVTEAARADETAGEEPSSTSPKTEQTGSHAPEVARQFRGLLVTLRGGGYIRSNKGFVDHASVFGYDFRGGGGGGIEASYEVVPRLSFGLSWSGFTMAATRRDAEIRITSQAVLLQARFAPYRRTFAKDFFTQLELTAGGGAYFLRQTYDDPTLYAQPFDHRRSKPGFRVGIDASVYWKSVGFMLGYAFHYAPAYVEDDLGGKIYAGGHEISAGLSFRF